MNGGILESDWKILRKLGPVALDRFCRRVLDEISALAADASKSNHERYLAIYKLLRRRDEELADTFNDLKRSNAVMQLACMRFQDVVSDEELARFSPETRASVERFLEVWREQTRTRRQD
jgi:hypothetical protein